MEKPFPHQERVRDFFADTPRRGLLLYHDLGTGKTCSSILAAAAASGADGAGGSRKRVFVLAPASLRNNFVRELGKCGVGAGLDAAAVEFINYNGLQHKRLAAMRSEAFDDAVVVVDEVHNFASRASTPGSVGAKLYALLMGAKGARFILLSGTPIVNRPFEVAFVVNLARGPMRVYDFRVGDEGAGAAAEALLRDARVETAEPVAGGAVLQSCHVAPQLD